MSLSDLYKHIFISAIKKSFLFWEKLGFHITPRHYYEPVPVVSTLKDEIWDRKTELLGISMNEDYQVSFLKNVCPIYKEEYDKFGLHQGTDDFPYYVYNGSFGEIDGDILYCMVRNFKPQKVVEVGSGWSTLLSGHALKKNGMESGKSYEFTAIEPFPRRVLKDSNSIGLTNLITKRLQDVDMGIFMTLEEDDILFLDSTHVVNIDSDVCREFLEILPRLKKGVIIHIHDIFLPYEYPKKWVKELKYFWNEAYLLQAFLMYNSAFEVLWAGNWMKTRYPEDCKKMFRSDASQSFWIRKIA